MGDSADGYREEGCPVDPHVLRTTLRGFLQGVHSRTRDDALACALTHRNELPMTRRTYENASIRVLWDSSLCIHTGICLHSGDGAFDVERHPWVDVDAAETETIVAAIEACPSGALRYQRLDGGPQERPQVPTTVVPWPNGPLMVRGQLEVQDRRGDTFVSGPRAALCRCGDSKNQPFCDLSHREAGFRDHPRVQPERRVDAANPVEISDRELG